ncbi:MAG TPA: hypothetical protein VGB49_07320, partial [Caulobacteraceae bacterium]
MKSFLLAGVAALSLFGTQAAAQTRTEENRAQVQPVAPVQPLSQREGQPTYSNPSQEPDVLLDVPNLSIDEINIEVDNLRAHLAVEARLANLLHLSAGADVTIDSVKINIKGVQAQVLLKVRLDNVAQIIDRTLTTVDRNPEVL